MALKKNVTKNAGMEAGPSLIAVPLETYHGTSSNKTNRTAGFWVVSSIFFFSNVCRSS